MNAKNYLLLVVLIINVSTTAFHYFDNFVNYDRYPAPDWITQNGVYLAWIALTLIGALGYWLYVRNRVWLAYGCLLIYSLTGLTSPVHYRYRTDEIFSAKMHLFIWCDFSVGLLMLGFVAWSAFVLKEWQRSIAS